MAAVFRKEEEITVEQVVVEMVVAVVMVRSQVSLVLMWDNGMMMVKAQMSRQSPQHHWSVSVDRHTGH